MAETLAWISAITGIALIVVLALSSFRRKRDLVYRRQVEQLIRSSAFERWATDFDRALRDEEMK